MKNNPVLTIACILLGIIALGGCGESKAPAEGDDLIQRYIVRGRVVAVKDEGKALSIHHEAIPQFVHVTGKADGMEEMVMDFTFGEGVTAEGVAVGDPVSFTMAVRWKPKASYWIENIKKLPPNTELNLTEKPQSGAGHSSHDHSHDHDHDHAH